MKNYSSLKIILCALLLPPLIVSCKSSSSHDFKNHTASTNIPINLRYEHFTRKPADTNDPAGNNVAANCSGAGSPWPDATVSIETSDNDLGTGVFIRINNARPHTLYTYWLRLKGTDDKGESFGGSPLTGGGSTPLAPSWSLYDLLQATGAGNGKPHVANGVTTDEWGNATLNVQLDFALFGGAYPFQNMPNFNPQDSRYPDSVKTPAIYPVDIVDPRSEGVDAPFMIRMVSHCTDELAHGLTPGAREPWFDYP